MGLILNILIGGGLGAALGYFGKCSSGTCPLTANPWRGALYGVVFGLLFHFASARRSELPALHSANVRLVNQDQFNAELSQASGPIVVDFFATWCGPCKNLSPMLDELARPLTNQIKFLKVDVDQSSQLAERFDIQGIPTIVFFRNGKELGRLVGLPAQEAHKQRLDGLAPAGAVAEDPFTIDRYDCNFLVIAGSIQTVPPALETYVNDTLCDLGLGSALRHGLA